MRRCTTPTRSRRLGRAHRRHGDDPAGRRRHPAGPGASLEHARPKRLRSISRQAVPCADSQVVRGVNRAAARRTSSAAAPASSPVRSSARSISPLRLAPGLRHRRAGRQADRVLLRQRRCRSRQPADIFTLQDARRANRCKKLKDREGLGHRRCKNLFARDRGAARNLPRPFDLRLGIRHVGETTPSCWPGPMVTVGAP